MFFRTCTGTYIRFLKITADSTLDSSAVRVQRQQMREYMVMLQCTNTAETCGETTMHQNTPSR
jgi:hypothetical protein